MSRSENILFQSVFQSENEKLVTSKLSHFLLQLVNDFSIYGLETKKNLYHQGKLNFMSRDMILLFFPKKEIIQSKSENKL